MKPRTLLPKMLEEHKLLGRARETAKPTTVGWRQLSQTIFKSTPEQAAAAAAAPWPKGCRPPMWAKPFTLAANSMVLRTGLNPREKLPASPSVACMATPSGCMLSGFRQCLAQYGAGGQRSKLLRSLILGLTRFALDRAGPRRRFPQLATAPAHPAP